MKKTNFGNITAAIVATLVLTVGSAFGGTATSNLTVSATVSGSCAIGTDGLAFGVYDPFFVNATTPLAGTGDVHVLCTEGLAAVITLDQGLNPAPGSSAFTPLRQMSSGGSMLGYEIFREPSRTITWGNTSETGETYIGAGVPGILTAFGQVPSGQNVPSGVYTDTVVATITF